MSTIGPSWQTRAAPGQARLPVQGPPEDTVGAMFNVGGPELIVIALVALIVLGPDKLPGALRQAGQFIGEIRKLSNGFQTDLRTAIADAEREAEAEAAVSSRGAMDAGRLAAQAELDALEAESAPSTDDTES